MQTIAKETWCRNFIVVNEDKWVVSPYIRNALVYRLLLTTILEIKILLTLADLHFKPIYILN